MVVIIFLHRRFQWQLLNRGGHQKMRLRISHVKLFTAVNGQCGCGWCVLLKLSLFYGVTVIALLKETAGSPLCSLVFDQLMCCVQMNFQSMCFCLQIQFFTYKVEINFNPFLYNSQLYEYVNMKTRLTRHHFSESERHLSFTTSESCIAQIFQKLFCKRHDSWWLLSHSPHIFCVERY